MKRKFIVIFVTLVLLSILGFAISHRIQDERKCAYYRRAINAYGNSHRIRDLEKKIADLKMEMQKLQEVKKCEE